jgi:putative peptide zinc metalloprotease protein
MDQSMATYLSLKPGCKIHKRNEQTDCYEYVIETADNRLYRVSRLARDVLEQLEEGTSLEEICGRLSPRYPGATADELQGCIVDMFRPILAGYDVIPDKNGDRPEQPPWKRNAFFLQITVIPNRIVAGASRYLSFLYGQAAAFLLVGCIIVAHVWCYWGSPLSSREVIHASAGVTLLLSLLSVVFHELGHSSALLRAGGRPGGIGIGMFLLMPVFFANVSQVWILPKRSRIVVDLGGIYFQQIAFAVFAIGAALTHLPSFRTACVAIDVMCLIAINPAFRFDGYWILVDWLGTPGLYGRGQGYLRNIFTGIFRKKVPENLIPVTLTKTKAAVFVCYAFLGNGFLAAAVLFNLHSLRGSMMRAWHSLPVFFHRFLFAWTTRDWATALNSFISLWFIFALAAALLFMTGLYLYRVLRVFLQWLRARSVAETHLEANCSGGVQ